MIPPVHASLAEVPAQRAPGSASSALPDPAAPHHTTSVLPPQGAAPKSLGENSKNVVTVEPVDIHANIDRISSDYSGMWEYEPGEERVHPKNIVAAFLADRPDATAVAAYATKPNGEKKWIGSAFGYAKRQDQPFEKIKQAVIASVFVHEDQRLQGAASKMVGHMVSSFANRGYKDVQLYASPEGKIVYKKAGFVDGDEMRHKLVKALMPLDADTSIDIRQADLKHDTADRAAIIENERGGTATPKGAVDNERALSFLHSGPEYDVPAHQAAFVAFENADGKERVLGTALAGVWKYPVPPTFHDALQDNLPRDVVRRDLYVPALRLGAGVSGSQAQNVYLRLAQKIVEHAVANDFTQINVQHAGAARNALQQVGFTDGIHMHKSLASTRGYCICRSRFAAFC